MKIKTIILSALVLSTTACGAGKDVKTFCADFAKIADLTDQVCSLAQPLGTTGDISEKVAKLSDACLKREELFKPLRDFCAAQK